MMMKINMCSLQDGGESTKNDAGSNNLTMKMNINVKKTNISISPKKFGLIIFVVILNTLCCIILFNNMQFLNGEVKTLLMMRKEIRNLEMLKMQVRALQVQVNYLKSQDNNQVINRARRSVQYSDSISFIEPPIRELSNPLEGPLVATFIGANPAQHAMESVYIGPWIKNNNTNTILQYDLTKYKIKENNISVEVSMSGLYMISVQIYYSGKATNHSYWLLLRAKDASNLRKLVTCATASLSTEASCYTNIITYLKEGDTLYVQQQETNRYIDMREGYSYLQFMLLQADTSKL